MRVMTSEKIIDIIDSTKSSSVMESGGQEGTSFN